MTLKALELKALQPGEKVYRVADEKGLYVEVSPNGSKLWRLKYRFNGKEKRLAFGAYPDVSLAEARELREVARKQVRDGIDPGHTRKMGKIAARVNAGNSFQSVAEEYIHVRLEMNGRAEATITKSRWLLEHLTPAIGSRPIAEIEPAELLDVLKRVESKGKRETARRIRSFASSVFRFGVATTRCKSDPAALLTNALTMCSACRCPIRSLILAAGAGGCIARCAGIVSASFTCQPVATFLRGARHGGWVIARSG